MLSMLEHDPNFKQRKSFASESTKESLSDSTNSQGLINDIKFLGSEVGSGVKTIKDDIINIVRKFGKFRVKVKLTSVRGSQFLKFMEWETFKSEIERSKVWPEIQNSIEQLEDR